MQTKIIGLRNYDAQIISEPLIVKTGKQKRRERRAKERKYKFAI